MAVETTAVRATIEEGIRNRKSVRGYLDRQVPAEVIREVLEIAQRAPSAVNCQDWHVYIASGEALDRIRKAYVEKVIATGKPNVDYDWLGKLEGVYWDRQKVCGLGLYGAMGLEVNEETRRKVALRNFQFFGASHVVFLACPKAHGFPGAINLGIYLQTLMLALYSRGIASCPMECAIWYPDVLREEFAVTEDLRFLAGCAFGYEDPEFPANTFRTDRAPIDDVAVFKDS